MKWMPIETAPKDGSLIIGSDGIIVAAIWWKPDGSKYPWQMIANWMNKAQDNAWMEDCPKHWMPLPEPPQDFSGDIGHE